jgi:hypothetical protein
MMMLTLSVERIEELRVYLSQVPASWARAVREELDALCEMAKDQARARQVCKDPDASNDPRYSG